MSTKAEPSKPTTAELTTEHGSLRLVALEDERMACSLILADREAAVGNLKAHA